jgi:hypothetical protein
MIIVYCENIRNYINTLCDQNAEFYGIIRTAEVEMKAERMITSLRFEINLNNTSEVRPYLTEHTHRFSTTKLN